MQLNYKIVITGGTGRFGSILKKMYKSNKLIFPNKKALNILSVNSIEKYLQSIKPKILIHLAGLSRPMKIHDNDIYRSIDLNIIGTANIVKICSKLKIKLIYFSTNYVYPGTPVITEKAILCCQLIIMRGQSLGGSLQFIYIKTLLY